MFADTSSAKGKRRIYRERERKRERKI